MFNTLKKAVTYRASLPAMAELEAAIEATPKATNDSPIGALDIISYALIKNPVTQRYVTPLENGYSVCMLIQEKILPAAAIKRELDLQVAKIEVEQERSVGRRERRDIKEEVMTTLLPRALVKDRIVHGFYHAGDCNFYVDQTSEKYRDPLLAMLIMCAGSITTSTVHISDQKQGLTTRLIEHICGKDGAFHPFTLGGDLTLNGQEGAKATFKGEYFPPGEDGYNLEEKIAEGAQVDRIQLEISGLRFTLTDKFHITGITEEEADERDYDDPAEAWIAAANARLHQLNHIVKHLCEMFGYEAPVPEMKEQEAA